MFAFKPAWILKLFSAQVTPNQIYIFIQFERQKINITISIEIDKDGKFPSSEKITELVSAKVMEEISRQEKFDAINDLLNKCEESMSKVKSISFEALCSDDKYFEALVFSGKAETIISNIISLQNLLKLEE